MKGWGGLDHSGLNVLQDTASLVFTKQYGFRFSSIPHRLMAEKVTIADVDFAQDAPGFLPLESRQRVQATHTGIVHAALMTWEVYGDADSSIVMSTDPEATRDNFARDMQWGQGLQLLEDAAAVSVDGSPCPFRVTAGEWLDLVVKFSADSVVVQVMLERAGAAGGGASGA